MYEHNFDKLLEFLDKSEKEMQLPGNSKSEVFMRDASMLIYGLLAMMLEEPEGEGIGTLHQVSFLMGISMATLIHLLLAGHLEGEVLVEKLIEAKTSLSEGFDALITTIQDSSEDPVTDSPE